MAAKVTPWFHWPTQPVREGWYDFRGYLRPLTRLYWNGRQFGYWQDRVWVHMADDTDDEWRGLRHLAAGER